MTGRLKDLKAEPYSQKEAEAAVGLYTDNGPRADRKTMSQEMEVQYVSSV